MNTLALPPLKPAAPAALPPRHALLGAYAPAPAPGAPGGAGAAPWAPLSDWSAPPSRRWALLAVLAVHALALFMLAQPGQFLKRAKPPAPVQVQLLEQPKAPPQPAQRSPAPRVALPVPVALQVPLPEFVSAQPRLEVAVQPPPASPAPPALEPPVTRPVSLAPPQPKPVSAGALRYRVEPAIEVPRLSRRAGEAGTVQLRVVFDVEGRPKRIELVRSSGYARLDAQALEAMQQSRIQPHLEDGRAIEVVAVATLEYELN